MSGPIPGTVISRWIASTVCVRARSVASSCASSARRTASWRWQSASASVRLTGAPRVSGLPAARAARTAARPTATGEPPARKSVRAR